MNDKQIQIITVASQLFSQKGFHRTSIQEIADAANIAKGSMYLYFKSKEDLLLSIYKYYYDLFFQAMQEVGTNDSMAPRERFQAQLKMQFEMIVTMRDFLAMQMKEHAILVNQEIHQFIFNIRVQTFTWYYQQLIEVYGEACREYASDATIMFNGMLGEYMGHLIIDQKEIDLEKLVAFLCNRLDGMMAEMMHSQPEPVLGEQQMADFLLVETASPTIFNKQEIRQKLAQIWQMVDKETFDPKRYADIQHALEIMEEELEKADIRMVVIQGLLSYLEGQNLPETRTLLGEIAVLLDAYEP